MAEEKKIITRRDFLRSTAAVAMGGLMGFPIVSNAGQKPKKSHDLGDVVE